LKYFKNLSKFFEFEQFTQIHVNAWWYSLIPGTEELFDGMIPKCGLRNKPKNPRVPLHLVNKNGTQVKKRVWLDISQLRNILVSVDDTPRESADPRRSIAYIATPNHLNYYFF
jgi:hypothetical protein